MIASFRHKGLQELYKTGKTRRIGAPYIPKCERILERLTVAAHVSDMNVPGFRCHKLEGKPERWATTVSANFRIIFGWAGESATDVDFEDYH